MRMIHPAAWIGFLLNAALAFIFFHALGSMDPATLDATQQEAWGELQGFILGTIRPLYQFLLLVQVLALVLIVYRMPFALPLVVICGMLTIPIGFVYLLGSLLTHYRIRYADFAVAPAGSAGARHVFPAFVLKRVQTMTIAGFIACAVLLFLQSLQMAGSFFALALVGLYCSIRAGRNHALALNHDSLTLTPALLAPTLLLPYSSITLATLHANETIEFEVAMPGGPRSLVWPLQTVAPGQRREAIEELGATLDASGVPLQ